MPTARQPLRRAAWPFALAALAGALVVSAVLAQPPDPVVTDGGTWFFRVLFTALVAVVVPVYIVKYGPSNFCVSPVRESPTTMDGR